MKTLFAFLLVFFFTVSCEKNNEFENVKPVVAPPSSEKVAKPTTKLEIPPRGKLPMNHPPIANDGKMPAGMGNLKTAKASSDPTSYGKKGALQWKAPTTWKATPASNGMRLAEYHIIGPKGSGSAVLAVYQLGGTVKTNIDRWIGQFTKDGKAVTNAKQKKEEINGLKVHSVDVFGTFNSGMAGGNRPDKEDQRLLGAIVETTVGLYFFKLIGPKKIVDSQIENFGNLLKTFKAGK